MAGAHSTHVTGQNAFPMYVQAITRYKGKVQTQRHLTDNCLQGPHLHSCTVQMGYDSTGPNYFETVDCCSTYLAGPAEPVWHTIRIK